MRKRILANVNRIQFAIIPTFGIIRLVNDYKFRIGFLWGFWQLSIGCFRVNRKKRWTLCPECKYWDSQDEWCEKHDREADGNGGCSSPEWRGIEEDK